MSDGVMTLRACDEGHVLSYPEALDDRASVEEVDLAFCSYCPCRAVYLVVISPGEGARIATVGGTDLFEWLEDQDWPRSTYVGPDGSMFLYRIVPSPLDLILAFE